MAAHNFYRVIRGDNLIWHDLPTGTYYGATDVTGASVRNKIKSIVNSIFEKKPKNEDGKTKHCEIIVSLAISSAWQLPVTTDKNKFPPINNYLSESNKFSDLS